VRLRITDSDGSSNSAAKTLSVSSQPPSASFTFSPDTPLSLQRVTFTSTSTDPDGSIVDVRWDTDNDGSFDDGTDIEASRVFDKAGDKTVRMRVTDDDGNQVTTTRTVPVTNRAPTAIIDAPSAAQKSTNVTFKSISADLDGSIAKTEWDTDNNWTTIEGTGNQITRSFPTIGLKTIRLRVTDNLGLVDEDV